MATFRVYIRRNTTKAPAWDWSQTVFSMDQQTAINHSYATWQQSAQNVPPLSQCTYQVRPAT